MQAQLDILMLASHLLGLAAGNDAEAHGKAEAIGAMVVSVLLILAGLAIGIQAVREMFTASKPPEIWVLAVLALVVVVKEGFFRFGSAVAK
jgi:divalent metal cation (Fe/Co/Zn/Cd) transporter